MWWVFRAHPTGMPRALHYTGDCAAAAVYPPSWSCPLMTAEWLSDNDGLVPLAIVGEADEISYREGGENATQDSSAMRVFIAGR